jgi:hypothetical protein
LWGLDRAVSAGVSELQGISVGCRMTERVEMRFMDDPVDLCRVYMFKVHVEQKRLLNKYVALWYIVKYLWKVVRHGN